MKRLAFSLLILVLFLRVAHAQRNYPHVVYGLWKADSIPFQLDSVAVTQFEMGWPDGDTLNPPLGQWSKQQGVMCTSLLIADGNERCAGGTSYLWRIQNKQIQFYIIHSETGLIAEKIHTVNYSYAPKTDVLIIYYEGKKYRYKRELVLVNE
ncbi:MAG: hypothetical protein ACRCYO_15160 [Bacteroidia bacterium]